MKNYQLLVASAVLFSSVSGQAVSSTAKFNIPGDFPGAFRIDFLGTGFKLNGDPAGSLSTASTIQFSVGAETSAGSGVYETSVSPGGFSFVDFHPLAGLPFDVYGVGTGSGLFDTNTGHWEIDMPTLFVVQTSGYGTRLDLHLTTQNISIPGTIMAPGGYTTTTASPMVLDESSPEPWGDLNLVAGGIVPHSDDLTLSYDWDLIDAIGAGYTGFIVDANPFMGVQYEFDIYGNDPLVDTVVPVPAAGLLFGSSLLGVVGLSRRRRAIQRR